MAAEKSQNVQDVFLNHVRKSKTPVTVFLVNGVKLQGIITWFDNFSVLLRRDGHTQLVYKHVRVLNCKLKVLFLDTLQTYFIHSW